MQYKIIQGCNPNNNFLNNCIIMKPKNRRKVQNYLRKVTGIEELERFVVNEEIKQTNKIKVLDNYQMLSLLTIFLDTIYSLVNFMQTKRIRKCNC